MYVMNNIVYGEQPTESVKVVSAVALDDMIMLVTFSTGETRLFDASILTGKVFEPLRNERIFKNPTVEHGVVTWLDGEIDCGSEFLYENSYEYQTIDNEKLCV